MERTAKSAKASVQNQSYFAVRALARRLAPVAIVASSFVLAPFPSFAQSSQSAASINANASLAPRSIRSTAAYRPGEVLVKIRGSVSATTAQAFIGRAVTQKGLSLKGSWSGLHLHHFAIQDSKSVESTIADLQTDPAVEYAEPNYIVAHLGLGVEGRTLSTGEVQMMNAQQVQMMGAPPSSGTYYQSNAPMQVPQAWAQMSTGKTAPIVAVIDTGLDLSNTVFTSSGAIWTNPGEIASNGIDDDRNGYVDDVNGWNWVAGTNTPQDDNGHGTHVSGIILGMTQDITHAPLAAASIKIMPLKFLDSSGSGATSDAVNAIYYAANNGARIMNNSWGGGGFSSSLLNAISYAYSKHILFVAAAGNASSNNDSVPTYPANYNAPNVIAAAATSDSDAFASFSNYGLQTVNLGSPGVSILSTLPNDSWGYESGTSMSTPMVSGIAALMMREQPSMYGYQTKSLIFAANNQIASLSGITTTQGRVNAYNAISLSKSAAISATQPSYDPSSVEAAMSPSSGSSGGCGTVAEHMLDRGGDATDINGFGLIALASVMLAPIALSLRLRMRKTAAANGRDARKHERFLVSSEVRMKVGDRELVGSVSSISLGGVQVDAEAMLENGGIVAMRIAAPDGSSEIEVQGRVVWNQENKHYGVAFTGAGEGVLSAIQKWTASLSKAG